jgi:RNA polymerase sigma-70 factor (ECF subfamily)
VSADDRELIAASLQGRTSAFGELVTRYQDRLYNTVYRLVENGEDARDIVQEAFLSAFQSLRSFKGDSLFFTWLYRIAVNAAMSYKRKPRLVHLPGGEGLAEPCQTSDASRPEHAMEMAEEEKRVHAALNRLSPEHRAVLVMKDMEGQKYEEMAEILQVPIGTVRSRLHRARLEMRHILLRNSPEQRKGQ